MATPQIEWDEILKEQNYKNKEKETGLSRQEIDWNEIINQTIGEEIPIKNKVSKPIEKVEEEEIFSDEDIKGHFTEENFSTEKDKFPTLFNEILNLKSKHPYLKDNPNYELANILWNRGKIGINTSEKKEVKDYKGEDLTIWARAAKGIVSKLPQSSLPNPNQITAPLRFYIDDRKDYDSIVDGFLVSINPNYKGLNRRFINDQIRMGVRNPKSILDASEVQVKYKNGKFEVFGGLTRGAIDVVNAYAEGGIDNYNRVSLEQDRQLQEWSIDTANLRKDTASNLIDKTQEYLGAKDFKKEHPYLTYFDPIKLVPESVKLGFDDFAAANFQLMYNLETTSQAILAGNIYGYDSPEYLALIEDDKRNQEEITASTAKIKKTDDMGGKILRASTSTILNLPKMMAVGNYGLPVLTYLENLHRGNSIAAYEGYKTSLFVGALGGLTKAEQQGIFNELYEKTGSFVPKLLLGEKNINLANFSPFGRQLILRGVNGFQNVVTETTLPSLDNRKGYLDINYPSAFVNEKGEFSLRDTPANLISSFIVGVGMPIGRGQFKEGKFESYKGNITPRDAIIDSFSAWNNLRGLETFKNSPDFIKLDEAKKASTNEAISALNDAIPENVKEFYDNAKEEIAIAINSNRPDKIPFDIQSDPFIKVGVTNQTLDFINSLKISFKQTASPSSQIELTVPKQEETLPPSSPLISNELGRGIVQLDLSTALKHINFLEAALQDKSLNEGQKETITKSVKELKQSLKGFDSPDTESLGINPEKEDTNLLNPNARNQDIIDKINDFRVKIKLYDSLAQEKFNQMQMLESNEAREMYFKLGNKYLEKRNQAIAAAYEQKRILDWAYYGTLKERAIYTAYGAEGLNQFGEKINEIDARVNIETKGDINLKKEQRFGAIKNEDVVKLLGAKEITSDIINSLNPEAKKFFEEKQTQLRKEVEAEQKNLDNLLEDSDIKINDSDLKETAKNLAEVRRVNAPEIIKNAELELKQNVKNESFNIGLNPKDLLNTALLVGYDIYKAGTTAAFWVKRMTALFGNAIRPYLTRFYNIISNQGDNISKDDWLNDIGKWTEAERILVLRFGDYGKWNNSTTREGANRIGERLGSPISKTVELEQSLQNLKEINKVLPTAKKTVIQEPVVFDLKLVDKRQTDFAYWAAFYLEDAFHRKEFSLEDDNGVAGLFVRFEKDFGEIPKDEVIERIYELGKDFYKANNVKPFFNKFKNHIIENLPSSFSVEKLIAEIYKGKNEKTGDLGQFEVEALLVPDVWTLIEAKQNAKGKERNIYKKDLVGLIDNSKLDIHVTKLSTEGFKKERQNITDNNVDFEGKLYNAEFQEYSQYGNADRYGQYNVELPNGTNYTEYLFNLPNIDLKTGQVEPTWKYFSSHWDDYANVFAHIRTTDRTTESGLDIKFAEEFQSDKSNDAATVGLQNVRKLLMNVPNWREEFLEVEAKDISNPDVNKNRDTLLEIYEKYKEKFNFPNFKDLMFKSDVEVDAPVNIKRDTIKFDFITNWHEENNLIGINFTVGDKFDSITIGAYGDFENFNKLKEEIKNGKTSLQDLSLPLQDFVLKNIQINFNDRLKDQLAPRVSPDPITVYKKSYPTMLKYLLYEAAKENKDGIGWTTSKQQAERYGKDIEQIESYGRYDKEIVNTLKKVAKDFGGEYRVEKISLGKDVPKRFEVLDNQGNRLTYNELPLSINPAPRVYGDDIVEIVEPNIERIKLFIDNGLTLKPLSSPKVGEWIKKEDGTFESSKPVIQEIHYLSLPSKFKEYILKKGFPYGELYDKTILKKSELGLRNQIVKVDDYNLTKTKILNELDILKDGEFIDDILVPDFEDHLFQIFNNSSDESDFVNQVKEKMGYENDELFKRIYNNYKTGLDFNSLLFPDSETLKSIYNVYLKDKLNLPKNFKKFWNTIKDSFNDVEGEGILKEDSKIRQILTPIHLAQLYPKFADVYYGIDSKLREVTGIESRIKDKFRILNKSLSDSSKDKIAKVLYEGNLSKTLFSDTDLQAKGLSPEEIDAYFQLREIQERVLNIRKNQKLYRLYKARNQFQVGTQEYVDIQGQISKVFSHYNSLRNEGYISLMRKGDISIYGEDYNLKAGYAINIEAVDLQGNPIIQKAESITDAAQIAQTFLTQGFTNIKQYHPVFNKAKNKIDADKIERQFAANGIQNLKTYLSAADLARDLKTNFGIREKLLPSEIEELLISIGINNSSNADVAKVADDLRTEIYSKYPSQSYQIKRDFTKGYDESWINLEETLFNQLENYKASYYADVGKHYALDILQKSGLEKADIALYEMVKKFIEDEVRPTQTTKWAKRWAKLRQLAFLKHMGFNPTHFFLNAFVQPVQMNWSYLARFGTGINPEVYMTKGINLANKIINEFTTNKITNSNKLNSKIPQEFRDIYKKLSDEHVIGNPYTHTLTESEINLQGKFMKGAAIFTSAGERVTRSQMAAALYSLGTEKLNLQGKDLYNFIVRGVYETQTRTGRGDNPQLFRSSNPSFNEFKKTFYQFSRFNQLWFEGLGMSLKYDLAPFLTSKGKLTTKASARHLSGLLLTAGIKGLPLSGAFAYMLSYAFGINPEDELNSILGNETLSDLLLYGASGNQGVSNKIRINAPIVDNININNEVLKEADKSGAIGAIIESGSQTLKYNADIGNLPAISVLYFSKESLQNVLAGEYLTAAEQGLPAGFANPLKAYDYQSGFKSSQGKFIRDRNERKIFPTTGETVLQAIGIQSPRVLKTYELKKLEAIKKLEKKLK